MLPEPRRTMLVAGPGRVVFPAAVNSEVHRDVHTRVTSLSPPTPPEKCAREEYLPLSALLWNRSIVHTPSCMSAASCHRQRQEPRKVASSNVLSRIAGEPRKVTRATLMPSGPPASGN